jgi:probable metal-binding protein
MNELTETKEGIYGHEVIRIVVTRETPWPVEELRKAVETTFGSGALFQNCHGDRFDFDELLGFLSSKGKITVRDGKVSAGFVPACDHH